MKFLSVCFALLSSMATLPAQTKDTISPSSDKTVQQKAQAQFVTAAESYEMKFAEETSPFKLNATPILKWTNPARTRENGAVFLWSKNKRPEVIGCCFTYEYDNLVHEKHELHTLATKPVEGGLDGSNIWKPATSLTFVEIPSGPKPATGFARQKLQMRLLARKFSATLIDRKAGDVKLRLMPTALATYEPTDHACKAGGIFSFAYGTDPEVLLILEVREVSGAARWHYAFARFHYFAVNASLDGKQVWKADLELGHENNRRSTPELREKPYLSFHVD